MYNDRNDTLAYFKQFSCEFVANPNCYLFASESIAVFFNFFVEASAKVLSGLPLDALLSYKLFLFLFALLVTLSAVAFSVCHARNSIFVFMLIFLDPRFFELSTNTLKQGLAFIAILISFELAMRGSKYSLLVKLVSSFSHVSGAVAFCLVRKKISFLSIFCIILFLVVFEFIGGLSFLAKYLDYGKLHYYLAQSEGEIYSFTSVFSMVYIFVMVAAIPLYLKTNDVKFLSSFNFAFFCFVAALITYKIGIGYRFTFYMAPFISLLVDRLMWNVKSLYGSGYYYFFVFIVLVVFGSRFLGNYKFIMGHIAG
ncbi:EpsG family protein [Psychromonas sp. MME2]|uniref:EpsG family protein n=1 Tax=unclassified Psychromonas TaxID=2614957 RepID=UPI00339C7F27